MIEVNFIIVVVVVVGRMMILILCDERSQGNDEN